MENRKNKVVYIDSQENLEQVIYRTGKKGLKGLFSKQINPYSLAAFWVGCFPFQVTYKAGIARIELEKTAFMPFDTYELELCAGSTPVQTELRVKVGKNGEEKTAICPLKTRYSVKVRYTQGDMTVSFWQNDSPKQIFDLESYLPKRKKPSADAGKTDTAGTDAKQESDAGTKPEQTEQTRRLEQEKKHLEQLQGQYRQSVSETEQAQDRALEKAERLADRLLQPDKLAQAFEERTRALAAARKQLADRQAAHRDTDAQADSRARTLQQTTQKKEALAQECGTLADEQARLRQSLGDLRQDSERRQQETTELLEQLSRRSGQNLSRRLILEGAQGLAAMDQTMGQQLRNLSKRQEDLEERLYTLRRQVEQAVDFRANELNQK